MFRSQLAWLQQINWFAVFISSLSSSLRVPSNFVFIPYFSWELFKIKTIAIFFLIAASFVQIYASASFNYTTNKHLETNSTTLRKLNRAKLKFIYYFFFGFFRLS